MGNGVHGTIQVVVQIFRECPKCRELGYRVGLAGKTHIRPSSVFLLKKWKDLTNCVRILRNLIT